MLKEAVEKYIQEISNKFVHETTSEYGYRTPFEILLKEIFAELEELISIQEAARILNVNVQTLRRWDRTGVLKAVRVGNRRGVGDRRYRKSDIEAYLSRNKK